MKTLIVVAKLFVVLCLVYVAAVWTGLIPPLGTL